MRVPIAEAVRGVSEPPDVAVGPPAQRLFGSRRFVLERLQLGNLVQQAGEIAVLGAGDLGLIVQIGADGRTGRQRRGERNHLKKSANPHPGPPPATAEENTLFQRWKAPARGHADFLCHWYRNRGNPNVQKMTQREKATEPRL